MADSPPIILDDHQKWVIRNSMKRASEPLLGILYRIAKTQEEIDSSVGKWTDLTKLPNYLDCSGLTNGICRKVGLRFPHGSQNQFNFTIATDKPQIGDFAFFGKDKDILQVYHVGMVFDNDFMIEARAYDPGRSFETGRVILRHRTPWEKYENFLGYRSHPVLA